MNKTKTLSKDVLSGKIIRYGCAAGAGALVSPLTLADGFDFMPDEGLPIVIDTTTTEIDPLLIDLEGDAIEDFEIFYDSGYGGGFQIRTLDSNVAIQAQEDGGFGTSTRRATRNDMTEYVTVDASAGTGPLYGDYISQGSRVFIDTEGISGTPPAYTPFRDNPGFLGLAIRGPTSDAYYAATLEVQVNSTGTELTILGGSYRQDGLDLYLGEVDLIIEDGFESTAGSSSQLGSGLQSLAYGKGR